MMAISRLSDYADPALCSRLVVKIGSSLLIEGCSVRHDWLRGLVSELADLHARGQEIIVVSSGAVALGAARLGLDKKGRGSLADAQAAAAVGQIALSGLWASLFADHDLTAAQMLLTLDDLEERRRYLNVTATLARLLDAGAIPVINENDSVATTEIRFGDNDRLAARVAQAGRSDAVLLLSDVNGLYDRDPAKEGAQLLPFVTALTPDIFAMATGSSSSGMGSGGMTSKLQAAEIAARSGIALAIVNGQVPSPIRRMIHEEVGTLFIPDQPRKGVAVRKAWLGGRQRLLGKIIVDDGAAAALCAGASLLAKGVTAIDGNFSRGDAVAICNGQGKRLAHGLCEYDAEECRRLMGTHSNEQAAILGYAPRSAIIHHNQMVLL